MKTVSLQKKRSLSTSLLVLAFICWLTVMILLPFALGREYAASGKGDIFTKIPALFLGIDKYDFIVKNSVIFNIVRAAGLLFAISIAIAVPIKLSKRQQRRRAYLANK